MKQILSGVMVFLIGFLLAYQINAETKNQNSQAVLVSTSTNNQQSSQVNQSPAQVAVQAIDLSILSTGQMILQGQDEENQMANAQATTILNHGVSFICWYQEESLRNNTLPVFNLKPNAISEEGSQITDFCNLMISNWSDEVVAASTNNSIGAGVSVDIVLLQKKKILAVAKDFLPFVMSQVMVYS